MSIVGTFAVMYLFGYSLDNLSLMALTLSVGFVVDDAIVMLENITRHMEMGKSRMQATLDGSKEIGFTIVSMTISLVAVFIPVLFMGGILGRLLHEFAVVIIVAVLISGFVSLTLTPMMCSRILKPHRDGETRARCSCCSSAAFEAVKSAYDRTLRWALDHARLTMLVFLVIVVATGWLFARCPRASCRARTAGSCSLSPRRRRTFPSTPWRRRSARWPRSSAPIPTSRRRWASSAPAASTRRSMSAASPLRLKPFGQRKSADEVIAGCGRNCTPCSASKCTCRTCRSIRIGGQLTKSPYQYVLQGASTEELYHWVPIIEAKLKTLPD